MIIYALLHKYNPCQQVGGINDFYRYKFHLYFLNCSPYILIVTPYLLVIMITIRRFGM